MKKHVKITSVAVFILSLSLLLLLTGCQGTAQQTTEKPKIINISYSYRPLNIPSIVALEKKMFEDEFAKDGIQVKWFELEGPATAEALAAKSIDFATSLNYVSAIIAKANGNDMKVISGYSKFPKGIGLVAGVNSGVMTVADLKGKKVALQKGTMLHEMLIKALAETNLKSSDVEIVNMASTDAANAVMQKQVDAAVIPDPLLTKAVASKNVILLRNAENLILGQAVIAARTDFLNQYPDIAKKFLEVHQKTLTWANANQEEALTLAAKVNQMDINAVKAMAPKFDFSLALDKTTILKYKDTAEFLKTNNFIKTDINTDTLITQLIDTKYLPK
ncbi:MAG: putative aliphatic sulfonates-binding protein [Candidatus Dichloromethanomonas elyunquensis]|nr:MAG: putative aliphatic sulfonates-binding protein [Candidatus Dichloromethanomonas elyunquensis]